MSTPAPRSDGPLKCESDPYEDGTPYFKFSAGWGAHGYEVPGFHFDSIMSAEDAAFLTRAYNAHDDLVKALEGVIRVADRQTDEFAFARAALAKAGGKS